MNRRCDGVSVRTERGRTKPYIYGPDSTETWRAECFETWSEKVDECGGNLGGELSGRMRGKARSATYDDT